MLQFHRAQKARNPKGRRIADTQNLEERFVPRVNGTLIQAVVGDRRNEEGSLARDGNRLFGVHRSARQGLGRDHPAVLPDIAERRG